MKKLSDFLNEGVNDPAIFKAIFLAGGPGSGKSFIVGKTAVQPLGFKLINSDPAFEAALKKANLKPTPEDIFSEKGQFARARAKALTDKQMKLAVDGRLGMVIDGTGKDYDKIEAQVLALRQIGYDVMMIFVNTDLETAQERNLKRERTLPAAVVEKMWSDVQRNIGKFQNLFRSRMVIIDNSTGADYETDVKRAYGKILTWVKSDIKNPVAQKWINTQRKLKEEHGAGEWGTPELTNNYKSATPGENGKKKKLKTFKEDWATVALSKVTHKKHYDHAAKTLRDIWNRKKKENKNDPKHSIEYYAAQIAKQYKGVDSRALAKMIKEDNN